MNPIKIIAEVGQAHDGSLGLAHSFIDEVAKTNADIIKFQTHIAHAESSEFESFRVNFSYEDKTRYDYWKRMEFTEEQWHGLKKHCDEVGLEFLSSPFSIEAFELIERVGVKRHKVASGEVNNFLLLKKMAETGKPLLISSGMSSIDNLKETLQFLDSYNNEKVLFQCTTAYPTPPEQVGLNVLDDLKREFDYPVGLSDHSGTIYPALGAVVKGAEFIEVHVTFDKNQFGPDATSSLTITELKQMVDGVRFFEKVFANPVNKYDNSKYNQLNKMFGKSLAVRKDLNEGETITEEMLETKKPKGKGCGPELFHLVVNHKLKRNLKEGSFLNIEDVI